MSPRLSSFEERLMSAVCLNDVGQLDRFLDAPINPTLTPIHLGFSAHTKTTLVLPLGACLIIDVE
jgi:hypothetical protein